MGPVISRSQVERVSDFIAAAEHEGGRVLAGGKRPDRPALARGNFLEPTVFDGVRPDMHLAQEEVFGPVLAVIPFEDEDGWSRSPTAPLRSGGDDLDARHRARPPLARRLQAGNVSINYPTVNPLGAPFGGYKQSGLGRELSRTPWTSTPRSRTSSST